MLTALDQVLLETVRELSIRHDAADVAAFLASLLRARGASASSIELTGARLISHGDPAVVRRARRAAGQAPSPLVATALAEGRVLHVRRSAAEDPLEAVRLAFLADEIAVAPIVGGHGAIVLFGHRIPHTHLRAAELLATCAAPALDRIAAAEEARAEIRARDAAIAVLTAQFDGAPLPYLIVDRDRRVLSANEAFARLVDRPIEDLLGATPGRLRGPGGAVLESAIADVLVGGRPGDVELDDGDDCLLATIHPLLRDGAISGACVSMTDVTAIRRAERKARAIAHAASTFGLASDRTGVLSQLAATAGRALQCEAHVVRADGIVLARSGPAGSDEGHLLDDADLHDLVRAPRSRGPARAIDSGAVETLAADDLAAIVPKGHRLRRSPVHLVFAAGQPADDAAFVLVLARRRAARRFDAEAASAAHDLARVAARAVDEAVGRASARAWRGLMSDLLATISRELRDPLTAVFARLFVAESTPSAANGNELAAVRRTLGRMRDSLQRLHDGLPADASPPPERLELTVVLTEATDGLERAVQARGGTLVRALQPTRVVRGDPRALRQALHDVATHVVAVAPERALFCLRVEGAEREAVASISHNGPGLTLEAARSAFDGLWTGSAGTAPLTLARSVFTAHGGRAWIETAPDHGVAYCFALPYADDERLNAAAPR